MGGRALPRGRAGLQRARAEAWAQSGGILSEGGRDFRKVRALNDSFRQIIQGEDAIKSVLERSTAHAYKKRDFPEYQVVKNRLDCCGKCRQWDWQVLPACKSSMKR